MREELQQLLRQRYPKLYPTDRTIHESLMPFGFECGDGWFVLIDFLSRSLQNLTNKCGSPQVEMSQVKEKFNELRFYVETADELQMEHIKVIEDLSAYVCEVCGKMLEDPHNCSHTNFNTYNEPYNQKGGRDMNEEKNLTFEEWFGKKKTTESQEKAIDNCLDSYDRYGQLCQELKEVFRRLDLANNEDYTLRQLLNIFKGFKAIKAPLIQYYGADQISVDFPVERR
mgnify:CR=1 FL=1